MIRNAGGRVFDELRSLAVLATLTDAGTVVVMHHTDCGMSLVTDTDIKKALLNVAPNDKANIEATKFGEIVGDVEDSVRADMRLLKASPWIKSDVNIIGLKHDIMSGLVSEVNFKRIDEIHESRC
jgi:carbonic anhydrase